VTIPGYGNTTTDTATGDFGGYTWPQLSQSWGGLGVSVYGACTVFTFSGTSPSSVAPDPTTPKHLDAGSLSLVGPGGGTPIPMPKTAEGIYSAKLGSSASALYLSPGGYTVTATGGADVAAFTSTMTLSAPFTWTNMNDLTSVTRANGVTVNWSGATGHVVITGYSGITTPQSAGVIFYCLAPASANSFTVPSGVLLALPVSATESGMPLGELTVWDTSAPGVFNPNPPNGLDMAGFSASFSFMKFMSYN
jgi:hypothetical protein